MRVLYQVEMILKNDQSARKSSRPVRGGDNLSIYFPTPFVYLLTYSEEEKKILSYGSIFDKSNSYVYGWTFSLWLPRIRKTLNMYSDLLTKKSLA